MRFKNVEFTTETQCIGNMKSPHLPIIGFNFRVNTFYCSILK